MGIVLLRPFLATNETKLIEGRTYYTQSTKHLLFQLPLLKAELGWVSGVAGSRNLHFLRKHFTCLCFLLLRSPWSLLLVKAVAAQKSGGKGSVTHIHSSFLLVQNHVNDTLTQEALK